MGIEGNIRKIYYDAWNIIINQDIGFEKRVKNPPDNAINSLISYVNTIVYTRVLSDNKKDSLMKISLINCFRIVMATMLNLIGVEAVEKM